MQIDDTPLEGVKIITPKRLSDERGFFCETYNQSAWENAGLPTAFVQDNQSLSRLKGTIRGLHYQIPPFAQAKLVRALRGAILDVAVDLRRNSPTYGQHVAIELSAENGRQLLIPIGFAHGFCTLEPDTEVFYKVSNVYSAAHDRGLAYHDPALNIVWPTDAPLLSEKDQRQPLLSACGFPFD